MNEQDRCIAIDTEFDNRKDPFIGTATDWKLRSQFFNLEDAGERQECRHIVSNPRIRKIYHPASVDIYTLSRARIEHKGEFEDTLTGSTLVDESVVERKGLKHLAVRWLGEDIKPARKLGRYKAKYSRQAKKEGRVFSYKDLPRWILKPYSIEDSKFTEQLWFFIRKPLKKFQALYDFEKSLTPAIIAMQSYGMLVDRALAKKMSVQYAKDIVKVQGEIRGILTKAGIRLPEFNPGSVKQLSWVLEKLDVPITKTNKWGLATDVETLKSVEEYPIVQKILLYRFLAKQKGTYFDSLLESHTTQDDPIAHFLLFQAGTRSGRFSAELIQTIPRSDESRTAHAPKLARKAFIPRQGNRLLAVDYKGLQMVLFFHFSGAEKLIELSNQGWDAHSATAQLLFGRSDDEYRKPAKTIGLGLLFGMGLDKLTRALRLSRLRSEQLLQRFYSKTPVREFMQKEISELYKTGVGVLEIHSDLMDVRREYHIPKDFAYQIVNYKIQGTEAYVMKHTILRVNRMLEKQGFDARIIMTIHDELLFDIGEKARWVNHVVRKICQTMEDHKTFKVKLFVEAKLGAVNQSWGDLQKIKWQDLAVRKSA